MQSLTTFSASLIWSCIAMVVLTVVVAGHMLASRIKETKEKRLRMYEISNSVKMAAKFEHVEAADNYRNLFEMPVLFYVLCALVLALGIANATIATLAWLYVAARCVHSAIHCGYNKVIHRFYAFISSVLILLCMWTWLASQLLAR